MQYFLARSHDAAASLTLLRQGANLMHATTKLSLPAGATPGCTLVPPTVARRSVDTQTSYDQRRRSNRHFVWSHAGGLSRAVAVSADGQVALCKCIGPNVTATGTELLLADCITSTCWQIASIPAAHGPARLCACRCRIAGIRFLAALNG